MPNVRNAIIFAFSFLNKTVNITAKARTTGISTRITNKNTCSVKFSISCPKQSNMLTACNWKLHICKPKTGIFIDSIFRFKCHKSFENEFCNLTWENSIRTQTLCMIIQGSDWTKPVLGYLITKIPGITEGNPKS